MRRRTAAAALGLALVAVACLPAAALAAASTTSTTTATTTTGTAPSDDPVIAEPPSSTSTVTGTSTTVVAESAPVVTPARRTSAADAHASRSAVVAISTAGCPAFCFSPAQTTIEAGGTVTWTNNSSADHTVMRCTPSACNGVTGGTGNDPNFTGVTIAVPDTKTAHYTFTQPGTYVYYCTLHGYAVMHGTITVTAAAAPSTTTAQSPGAPAATTSVAAADSNALASTGGSMNGLIAVGAMLLVVGLAVVGLSARRRSER